MLPVFNKEVGHWHEKLGKEIDSVLQNTDCSRLLKAVLLYFFFRSFDVSKEALAMRAFQSTYQKLARDKKYSPDTIYGKGKDYMEIFLEEVFKINKPFECNLLTAKLFYSAQQTQNICMIDWGTVVLEIGQFLLGVVDEETSPVIITFLLQLLTSYFIIRNGDNQIMGEFNRIYKWLTKMLTILKQQSK